MKKILIPFFLLFAISVMAQNVKYSRVKVLLKESNKTVHDLQLLGIAVDHGEIKKDIYFTSDFSNTEIQSMHQAGFKTEIVIDDVQKFYAEQNQIVAKKKSITGCASTSVNHITKPNNFHLGSYAGYYTYAELLTIIDSMRLLYPNLISIKQSIDTFKTIENRPIYWLRISNHPDSNQILKPQMVYTALHHAREPASISQLIYYMWYLLENYSTNTQVQAIINNTELYFVPCLNPDGYIYNYTTNPNGGGMWRKNRRDNLDGTYGVDLNRNYGYNWGYDNIGSSNMTSSDTYRGTTGFSEPETKAIKWFCENHDFKINLNYHTYSNDLIYPWGFIASYKTVDSTLFDAFGAYLTEENKYKYGTGDQTVGYVTNGDSDDWGYGEQTTKNKTYAFTPEVGPQTTGFYPPASDIEGLCADNVIANIKAAKLLLNTADVHSLNQPTTNQLYNKIIFSLQRIGLDSGATYTVSITPLDTWITNVSAPKVFTNLSFLQTIKDSFSYNLSPTILDQQIFKYLITVNNGLYDDADTISVTYYHPTTFVAIDNNIANNWNVGSSNWNTTATTYVTAPNSITDSPLGNYNDFTVNTITLKNEIDLTNAVKPILSFYCKWQIEKDFDYVTVQATSNNGINWISLCGLYTHQGNINQILDEPIYDGEQLNWVKEQMMLSDFINQKIKIRFQLVADQGFNMDGFYFDDMKIYGVDTTLKTGVESILSNNKTDLQIFPNPSSQSIIVKQHGVITSLYIENLLGQIVVNLNELHQSETEKISISELPNGIYFIKTKNKTGVLSIAKLIKN